MCVVFVLPSPHQINWLRVDEDVPPHAVVTGSDLYIENLNKSFNGTYRCVASNAVGEAYDDYILYVYGRYHITPHLVVKCLHHSYISRLTKGRMYTSQSTGALAVLGIYLNDNGLLLQFVQTKTITFLYRRPYWEEQAA